MSWTDCLLSPASCAVGMAADEAAESTWESFTRWAGQGLAQLATNVFDLFSQSTLPNVDARWFRANLDTIVTICLPVLVAFFVLQVLTGVVRREAGYLGRALVGVAVATIGLPISLALVEGLSAFVDVTATYIVGEHTADGFARLVDVGAALSAGTAGGFVLVAMLVGILSMLALYVVLLLRKVALLAVIVFVPLALLGWTWDATRVWLRRWAELTAALILSKLVMAVVFALGLSAIGGAGGDSDAANLGDFLAGTVLLALAAFTPWVTFHFLHFAGTEAATTLQSATQQGARAAKSQTVDRTRHVVHQAIHRSPAPHRAHTAGATATAHRGQTAIRGESGPPRPESNGSSTGRATGVARDQDVEKIPTDGKGVVWRYPDPKPHRPLGPGASGGSRP